ncbi:MAG: hypothetical protein AB7F86_17955 [Bdellovibrionales bacterium]
MKALSRTYSQIRKPLIVAFVCLNVAAFLFSNIHLLVDVHDSLHKGRRPASRHLSHWAWAFSWYPYLLGLDQSYSMFSFAQRRMDYFLYYGVDENHDPVLFPVELSGQRSWFQRHLVDHKAGKFHLNMYDRPEARAQYARYLCHEMKALSPSGFQEVEIRHYVRDLSYPSDRHISSFQAVDDSDALLSKESVACL